MSAKRKISDFFSKNNFGNEFETKKFKIKYEKEEHFDGYVGENGNYSPNLKQRRIKIHENEEKSTKFHNGNNRSQNIRILSSDISEIQFGVSKAQDDGLQIQNGLQKFQNEPKIQHDGSKIQFIASTFRKESENQQGEPKIHDDGGNNQNRDRNIEQSHHFFLSNVKIEQEQTYSIVLSPRQMNRKSLITTKNPKNSQKSQTSAPKSSTKRNDVIRKSLNNIKTFQCDFDGKSFSNKVDIVRHMLNHRLKVKCKICDAELKIKSLGLHMRIVHYANVFKCQICSKIFGSNHALGIHLKSHNKKFECEKCRKRFSQNYGLKKHIQNYHENPRNFGCELCDKKFNRRSHLKNHQKVHDKYRKKPFKCDKCDYATDRQIYLKHHIGAHERQEKKFAAMVNPLKCNKCPALLKNRDRLRNHMNYVHATHRFQCDLCGLYVKSKGDVIKHIRVVHLKKLMADKYQNLDI